MSERIRVRNATLYTIGLKTQSGIEYSIKPGAFMLVPGEDIEYNMAIAPSLFTAPCQLVVENKELNDIMQVDPTVEESVVTPELCERYLKGSNGKLRAWLIENNFPHVVEMVYNVASGMDLNASKLKLLKEVMPQKPIDLE